MIDVENLAQQIVPVLAGLKPTDQCELNKITMTGSSQTYVLDPEPTGLLKDALEGHLPALVQVINERLQTGCFREDLKHAVVKPCIEEIISRQELAFCRIIVWCPSWLVRWWRKSRWSGWLTTCIVMDWRRCCNLPTRRVIVQTLHSQKYMMMSPEHWAAGWVFWCSI